MGYINLQRPQRIHEAGNSYEKMREQDRDVS